MRRTSISLSIFLHAMVLVIAVVSFPWLKKDYVTPPPISVEMVDISQLAQTTKVAPVPIKKEEKKVDKPAPPKPPPAAKNTANEAVQVVKTIKPDDKPEPKKDEKVLVDANAPPEKKLDKKDEKKKKVTEEPKKDFTSVLKNLADEKPAPAPVDKKVDLKANEKPESAQPLPIGQRMTMTENDAFMSQLKSCWNVPIGAKDVDKTTVDLSITINQDRTLQSVQIVDQSRYNSDSFYRVLADSALRAVRSSNCSPFDLPPDKYEAWKDITVTFDPSQMFN